MAIEYSDGSEAKTRFNQMPMKSSSYSKDSQHQMRFPTATQQQYQSCLIDTEKFVMFEITYVYLFLFIVTTLHHYQFCLYKTEKLILL